MTARRQKIIAKHKTASAAAALTERQIDSGLPRRDPLTRREIVVVAGLVAIAAALRFAHPERISVEHWDEAVYASNLFTDGGYPARHLYAPPLVPALIEFSMLAFGPSSFAAVLPNLVLGTLTVPLCWWAAREWFGGSAGIAAGALAALSDFHIVYSRTALTDPALCFFFLLAVYCGWRALAGRSAGWALIAGAASAAAWATKYNGWLPLAVLASGFVAWFLFERREHTAWAARFAILLTIAIVAAICWIPVWQSLPHGYAEVTQNHAKYFVGLGGWWNSLVRQAGFQQFFNGPLTRLSVLLTCVLPLIVDRRTMNVGGNSPVDGPTAPPSNRRPPWLMLCGLAACGVVGGVALISMAAGLLLSGAVSCLMVVWRKHNGVGAPLPVNGLAGWLMAAWLIGLFVAVPCYTPYSRLALPWLVSAWIAAAAVIGRVVDFVIIRSAGGAASPPFCRTRRRIVDALGVALAVGIALTMFQADAIPGWQDRTDREQAVKKAAATAGESLLNDRTSSSPNFLVYGEPAIFFHLALRGHMASPIGDFDFLSKSSEPIPAGTFLLAYATPALDDSIRPYAERLKPTAVFEDTPSDLVLLDSYDAAAVGKTKARPQEELRLYSLGGLRPGHF